MIKQAIIPLAGLGTRLLPLTSDFAKELLPINGKPGLEYIIEECIDAGIHDGHISLIKKSIKYSKKTIVSIFINPKQFNNKNDFKSYPSNIKKDLKILKKFFVGSVGKIKKYT